MHLILAAPRRARGPGDSAAPTCRSRHAPPDGAEGFPRKVAPGGGDALAMFAGNLPARWREKMRL
jgi:hypothetical protein